MRGVIPLENRFTRYQDISGWTNKSSEFLLYHNGFSMIPEYTGINLVDFSVTGPLLLIESIVDFPLSQEREIKEIVSSIDSMRYEHKILSTLISNCEFDSKMENNFYQRRDLVYFDPILFKETTTLPDSLSNPEKYLLCKFKYTDTGDSIRLKILKLDQNQIPIDKISLVFKPIVHHLFKPEEFLLLEYFVYHFFKHNVVRNGDRFNFQYDPIETLTNMKLPVYMPMISLKMKSNFSDKLLSQWPKIMRVILKDNKIENLQSIRTELENRLRCAISSPEEEINFIIRFGLTYGELKPLQEFKSALGEIDMHRFKEKIQSIISGKIYVIYWGSKKSIDQNMLKKIDTILKYEKIK